MRPVSGVVKGDGQSLTLDAVKGKLGDGDATGRVNVRKTTDGVALDAEVRLKNVDGSALHYGALAMPAGRVSAQMTFASQGRSASALVGALSGSGLVTLADARIPGLDPRVFDVAINASDGGQASDDIKLRQIVEQSLSANPLPVASAQIPFNVRDGRLRVGATTLDGEGAQAIVSGGYDIAADQVDIRASLASTSAGSANNRPEVQIFAVGPPNAINRTVDVAALSSWLAVRAIDRETRRLDSIEHRIAPSPASPPAASPPATASLPIEPPPGGVLPSSFSEGQSAGRGCASSESRSAAASRETPGDRSAASAGCAAGIQCPDTALGCAPSGTGRDTARARSKDGSSAPAAGADAAGVECIAARSLMKWTFAAHLIVSSGCEC